MPKWLPLTLILAITTLIRLQYLDMPLERDESIYSYIGKLALNGGKPYVDFFEMKPPVMFYSYALLVGIFGYSATGVHLAATALAALNAFFTRSGVFGETNGRRFSRFGRRLLANAMVFTTKRNVVFIFFQTHFERFFRFYFTYFVDNHWFMGNRQLERRFLLVIRLSQFVCN